MPNSPEEPLLSPLALTLLLASSLTVMSNATIAPSLPAIADHYRDVPGIATLAGLLLTLPSLAVALSAFGMGVAADRFGRRKVMLIGLVAYGFAGSTGLWMDGLPELLAGRFALGVAVAAVMTAATALISDLFSGPQRDKFMGVQGAAMSIGAIVFLVGGGFLAEQHWRAPFLLYLAAFGVLILAVIIVPRTAPAQRRAGADDAAELPVGFVAGVMALAALIMAVFYVIPVRLPFYLRELGVNSPSAAGMAVAAGTVTSTFASLAYGRLRSRLSPPAIFAYAFGAIALGFAIVSFAHGFNAVVGGVLISGLGLGLMMPNQAGWLMSRTPPARRGMAAGLLTMAIFSGQFVSPLISGPVAGAFGLAMMYRLTAALLVAMMVVMVFVARREKPLA